MSSTASMSLKAGDRIWIVGDLCTVKATGEDTGGTCTVFEIPVSPGKGTPLHSHAREDEFFYILEGEVEFVVHGQTIQAEAGAFVQARRGGVHRYANTSAKPARMLLWATPSGIEHFFAEIGERVEGEPGDAPALDIQKIIDCAPRYGLTILPPG